MDQSYEYLLASFRLEDWSAIIDMQNDSPWPCSRSPFPQSGLWGYPIILDTPSSRHHYKLPLWRALGLPSLYLVIILLASISFSSFSGDSFFSFILWLFLCLPILVVSFCFFFFSYVLERSALTPSLWGGLMCEVSYGTRWCSSP